MTESQTEFGKKVMEFLQEPGNVARMIVFTERGLPALTGIAERIEEHFGNGPESPLANPYNRQAVGRMIKIVMSSFGYDVIESGLANNTHLREFARSKLFKTSAIYKKCKEAERTLLISIDPPFPPLEDII